MNPYRILKAIPQIKSDLQNVEENIWTQYIKPSMLWGGTGGTILGMLIGAGLSKSHMRGALMGGLAGLLGGGGGGAIAGYRIGFRKQSPALKQRIHALIFSDKINKSNKPNNIEPKVEPKLDNLK